MSVDDLINTALAMASSKKTCDNCYHYRDGDCAMYSCNCADDIAHHATNPCWWMSYEEGMRVDKELGLCYS